MTVLSVTSSTVGHSAGIDITPSFLERLGIDEVDRLAVEPGFDVLDRGLP